MANETTVKLSTAELTEKVIALETALAALTEKVEELSKPVTKPDTKEMSDEDARNVLFGDLKDVKHKDAAAKLGLTYGQIYSCRLEFTFKNVHKEMKEKGIANQWKK
jgi:hypothetical protein